MHNSSFGKTMENLRKRICISKPIFISQIIFSKNFVAIHQIKPILTLNKLIFAGFNILD